MTHSSFAATAPRARPGVPAYEPGVCNIGPAEIARRRRAGHVGLAVTVIGFVVLVAVDAPPLARLLLVIPAAVAASGYLQAWLKFCAAYGSQGVFALDAAGDTRRITDPDALARDRRRARQIGLTSFLIGLAVAVAAVLVPL
jgi:hypothetical protein